MRFVALKHLTYTGPDGAKYSVLPGDPVPDFETWPSGVRHANLAAHIVRDREALAPQIDGREIRMVCYGRTDDAKADDVASTSGPVDASFVDDEDILKCPHCDHRGFTLKNSLMQHIKRKH